MLLAAIGLAITFGLMGVINMAHGGTRNGHAKRRYVPGGIPNSRLKALLKAASES